MVTPGDKFFASAGESSHIELTSMERRLVKKIKINLVKAFIKNPILFRGAMFTAGLVAGLFHVWFGNETSMNPSKLLSMVLLVLSALIYAGLLTIYRLVQVLFQQGSRDPRGEHFFDERLLVQAAGIFWFIPYGISSSLGASFFHGLEGTFGSIMIVQGLAVALGAWLSMRIKK